MDDQMADQFFKSRARLSRLLGRSFPDASDQEVEDALSDALVVVLQQAASQDVVVSASRWLSHFEGAIAEHGKSQADALRRALLNKMETGDPDGVVAARHGLTRARLNRAWNLFLDRLLEG